MYRKAKSCVKTGNVCSDHFYCDSGVGQGENLSPVLFAIYLNDLQEYMAERSEGLPSLGREARGLGWEREDESLMLKMFMLLYADDTTICSESAEGLQQALGALSDYCDKWSLRVNVYKTKVVVFSRGKIRKVPTVKYKGQSLEVVFEFQYLGVCFNYNKFNVAQKSLYDKASRAMFGLLKKCRKLMLPLDIQTELFDRLIVPILLYGCEVWCPMMTNLASKLQLRFYRIILKLSKSAPSCMVYGELGQFPLEVQAKCRMLNFWFKPVNINYKFKFSNIMYKFRYEMYREGKYKSPFLSTIETVLNGIGLSGMWTHQFDLNYSNQWFKSEVTRVLRDQYIQQWSSETESKEIYYNYRMFKNVLHLKIICKFYRLT